jgi:hypothetical protein
LCWSETIRKEDSSKNNKKSLESATNIGED